MPDHTARRPDGPTPRRGPIELRAGGAAAFVGPAAGGPIEHPAAVTSVSEFAQLHGELDPVALSGAGATDFLSHAVRAYFAEGGTRLYVVRTRDAAGLPPPDAYESALHTLAGIADVSVVAAPGSTHVAAGSAADQARAYAVVDLLIRHAERTADRIALLDPLNDVSVEGVRAQRNRCNSSYAALYYPWLRVAEPATGGDVLQPPSGSAAGIYARVDAQRGPWAVPAGESARLARGLEREVDAAQSDSLGRAGINVFRELADRGVVLWSARTTSDDPEWQYVNVRRYATFLERSLDEGLRWAVFEPNGGELWSAVREAVETFLAAQWRAGALTGRTAADAYFVRCDRTTMTQQDLDAGRLTCVVGVAPVRPAEFVVVQIGLWTADHYPPP